MDEEVFRSLSPEKQVEEFNKLLKTEGSIAKAARSLGMTRDVVKGIFNRNGYRRDPEINQYIKKYIPVEVNKQDTNSNIIESEKKEESNIRQIDMSELENIIENKFNKLLEKYLKNNSSNDTDSSNIEISSECDGEVKYNTYGVYESIAKKFDEYVKNHPRFKKVELTTQALIEFMKNHP